MSDGRRDEALLLVSTQLYGLTAVVRAMIATHPQPEKVRLLFDQLLMQMLADPVYLGDKKNAQALREFGEAVFQPSLRLDTED
ncbi:hypothetical protein [Solimonas marina]|uniref:Uncharacterized protein n=1 Tax=Solimonas marina TaxID=2714601 RepID=A0A970B5C0_9GAMM|nr:hypothetical protein [Solimonas marina]NKF21548.1 hypothetical protein [Solimonas marina]